MDGSNSMSPDRFFTGMLDLAEALYCSLDPTQENQAGLIVFNQNVQVASPLAMYSRSDWTAQINTVRATRNTLYSACCSCCTPLAEAFYQALQEFQAKQRNLVRIALVITDGVPSNNNVNTGGNPIWWYVNPTVGFSPSVYDTQIVPAAAASLKAAGHRLFLVGVPSANGDPPNLSYFRGQIRTSNYCIKRDGHDFCSSYETKLFPIVSTPINQNSFAFNTLNVNNILKMTVGSLCANSPTLTPTGEPTTVSPSFSPTAIPSKSPSKKPSMSPSSKPTHLPTNLPTTSKPSSSPTASPIPMVFQQVDLTFLLDRSKSTKWHDPICFKTLKSLPPLEGSNGGPPTSFCWEMFMRFILNQADSVANLTTETGRIGWADEFDGVTYPSKGVRVNIIGFACTNEQKSPKVFPYSTMYAGGPITSRSKLLLILEQLRTNVTPDGGTCPALSIEYAVKLVEAAPQQSYPLQVAIIITDGVFYDGNAPIIATQGLEAYKVLRFSIGIAVANSTVKFGMTPKEIQIQRQQLSSFVQGNMQYYKDLGQNGWSLLLGITQEIADSLPEYYYQYGPNPIPRYTWCGFRRILNCRSDDWRMQHCQWSSKAVKQYGCEKISS